MKRVKGREVSGKSGKSVEIDMVFGYVYEMLEYLSAFVSAKDGFLWDSLLLIFARGTHRAGEFCRDFNY
jgi:hypothetical protein